MRPLGRPVPPPRIGARILAAFLAALWLVVHATAQDAVLIGDPVSVQPEPSTIRVELVDQQGIAQSFQTSEIFGPRADTRIGFRRIDARGHVLPILPVEFGSSLVRCDERSAEFLFPAGETLRIYAWHPENGLVVEELLVQELEEEVLLVLPAKRELARAWLNVTTTEGRPLDAVVSVTARGIEVAREWWHAGNPTKNLALPPGEYSVFVEPDSAKLRSQLAALDEDGFSSTQWQASTVPPPASNRLDLFLRAGAEIRRNVILRPRGHVRVYAELEPYDSNAKIHFAIRRSNSFAWQVFGDTWRALHFERFRSKVGVPFDSERLDWLRPEMGRYTDEPLEAGEWILRARCEGHREIQQAFTVEPNGWTWVEVQLRPR